jgi:hypothetical protein
MFTLFNFFFIKLILLKKKKIFLEKIIFINFDKEKSTIVN